MLIRVGLPEDDKLVLSGDIILGGRRYDRLEIFSNNDKSLKIKFAVFKHSPTGKVFGKIFKFKWELVDILNDISSAYELAKGVNGEFRVWVEGWGGNLKVKTHKGEWVVDSPLRIKNDGVITVENLWVGRGFHWQNKKNLKFSGDFDIYAWGDKVKAVNIVGIKDYIASVIGSEMLPKAPYEALKVQSLAARTNLFRTAGSHHPNEPYDICSEDHCQVYLGLERVSHETLRVSEETDGEIITFKDKPIEARYSKCCGGVMERFSVVWGGDDKPYNINLYDGEGNGLKDISSEERFEDFLNQENAFCNINFPGIENLYRWKIVYSEGDFLSSLGRFFKIKKMFGFDGIKRGYSGRIYEMKVLTDNGEITLKGEYFIRQVLGKPFLPSSAFKIYKDANRFILRGMGWGHGVGMCQMGAIGMALKGYNYIDIVQHYYPGVRVIRWKP